MKQLYLILPLALLISCGVKYEQRDQSPGAPRQHPMSEYPGSGKMSHDKECHPKKDDHNNKKHH